MAALNHLEIFLEFEPIVKLACDAIDCQNNLLNASNIAGREMAACNLKQITIGKGGNCLNYKTMPTNEVKDEN